MRRGLAIRGTLAAIGLLLAAACGCRPPLRAPEEPRGAHFSVLTYNVNYGGRRMDLGLAAILRARADIVCLQETSPGWERYLRPRLSGRYPHCLFRHASAAGGMAVFSRWPLREISWHRPPAGWFHGLTLRAGTPTGPVQILSVHLRPPLGSRGGVSPAAYQRTKSVRLAEITELEGRLDSNAPRIVLGDFNEEDNGRAVKFLTKKGYTDALGEFDRKSDTWHWRAGPVLLNRRFDHIVYSAGLHCCRAEVIRAGASDHLPVRATLQRRASE
jgi:endonuclease/exonuclease/phosphatase family metal-dependent hydrolase